MYVKDSDETKATKAHCGTMAARYFSKQGIPIFGHEDGKTVFLNTKKFEAVYKNAPIWVKFGVSIKITIL